MFIYRKDSSGKWMPLDAEIKKKVKGNTDVWYKMNQQEFKIKVKGKWVDK